KPPIYSACTGIQLTFPPGQNHHLSYPFGLHAHFQLPWDYSSEGERFFLRSKNCRKRIVGSDPGLCKPCRDLDQRNEALQSIRDRIADGIDENTSSIYFPIGGLLQKIQRKQDQVKAMRLTKLNDTRLLAGKIAELDLHKQLMMAIATGDVPRVSQLLHAGINNGESINAMLERFYRACVDVHHEGPKYNPKGFSPDDYMVGLCVLRLGGARLADILHRALGLPGLTTLRKHSIIRPLRASPGMPTVAEIEENIDAYTVGEEIPVGPVRIIHRVVMLDEVAVEKRARWDDKTNMILGACREHSHTVPLDFSDLEDAKTFFAALDRKDVHLASEATVVAFGALAREPHIYNPRPICISGTCKHEKGDEHAAFVRTLNTAANNRSSHGNIIYRTVSFASDGEAKRGLAFAMEFMKYRLAPTSPIYPLLSPLEFMNLLVGLDDVTQDKDFRHLIKALRALVMRKMGVNILGAESTPAVVKQHLRSVGISTERVNALLNPNDRQDVPLAYGLLKELWSLPDAPPTATPTFIRARKALQIFGRLAYNLVMPYIYLNLTLREQLTHLSTAAHLLLILFTTDHAGTSFMANQTFVNIMVMIKNTFFCVAKAKVDIPDSEFFLILLGTDRLEKLFGLIRTAVGTDSNFDLLQLSSRASNLTEVYIILGLKPHWDRGPRRIKLHAVINEQGEVSRNADHVSPTSWIGDLHVANVLPHACWLAGRFAAEGIITTGQETLRQCALVPGFDILSPFGELLVNTPDPDVAFEVDPELIRLASPLSNEEVQEPEPLASPSDDAPEDFEDVLAIHDTGPKKYSPHVDVAGKKVSKASILKDLMQNRAPRLSTDRTKRVANQSTGSHITFDNPTGAPALRIGNPIATMVECEGQEFLAVGQVNNIILGSRALDSIVLDLLPDPATKISYQILQLIPSDSEDSPTAEYDWKWSLGFESPSVQNIPGNLIHPMNPTVSNRVPGHPTYLFSSQILITVAASINSQLAPTQYGGIPTVQRSEKFPYRWAGKACFHIELDLRNGNGRGEFMASGAPFVCTKCFPTVKISNKNFQRVLEHNGAHILFDKTIMDVDQPCGLCLRPYPMCTFVFQKSDGNAAARQIDWSRSTCLNPLKFQMAAAMRSSENSPCTNYLVLCPLQCGFLVWTYNLTAHYRGTPHNLKSLDNIPVIYTRAPLELTWMNRSWTTRHEIPTTRKLTKPKPKKQLALSDAHRAVMVFR
ncbi:hypothetical protein FB451DRAFT_1049058, partial [Mycena latifolia]